MAKKFCMLMSIFIMIVILSSIVGAKDTTTIETLNRRIEATESDIQTLKVAKDYFSSIISSQTMIFSTIVGN